ncbi:hypothetical protein EYF80_020336 [Liparis tanakae]|uniref:Uncharacterized protein n=1 Tax=Liparis tanakae TaxID=230148 RepID=A0A4Z2HX59_9TELE|nr:hypothetical protein EYF80_020336 [Liparis tanakae]
MLQPVPVDGVDVEPDDERGEQPGVGHHGHGDEDALPVLVEVPEGDVGQEGEGEQQAAEEAEDVGDVVDPRQEAAQEEEEDDAQQLEEGFPRLLQDLPTLKQLNKQAGEEPELRPRRTHLEGEEQRRFCGRTAARAPGQAAQLLLLVSWAFEIRPYWDWRKKFKKLTNDDKSGVGSGKVE